jgi:putative SOS response-associated peptidase YedK
MCYNLAFIEKRIKRYDERYQHVLPPDLNQRLASPELPLYYFVSGFSHPLLPIVKHDGIFLYEWGLIPFWNKDTDSAKDIQGKTLNAVGETIFEKPSFRKSIKTQRCLLGISGFYEWREVSKVKYPYYIKTLSHDIFSLGCIYEHWVDSHTGEIRNTFSIITTPANPLMENIHNIKKRMPLILSKEDEKQWIDPSLNKEDISRLIKPYEASDMQAYSISQAANSARNNRNVPEIMDRVDYPALSLL